MQAKKIIIQASPRADQVIIKTLAELNKARIDFFKQNDPTKFSRIALSRLFAIHLLEQEGDVSDDTLKKQFLEQQGNIASKEKGDVFEQIAEHALNLRADPDREFSIIARQAINDISSIDKHLNYIDTELQKIQSIKTQNGILSTEKRYYRNKLEYYRAKNLNAQEEINKFLARNITAYTLARCTSIQQPVTTMFARPDTPYPYAIGRLGGAFNYDVRYIDELSNKFLDLQAGSHNEIRKLFNEDESEFFEFSKIYITGSEQYKDSVHLKIKRLIARSHILHSRKEVIERLLDHYAKGDFLSFISMAALQIEGIFSDICQELGISEKELDLSSLNRKLELISGKMNFFLSYEYYAFHFPILRNHVAHGELIHGNIERTSIMLMLDLLPACELACSQEIPINKRVTLMKSILDHGRNEDILTWVSQNQQHIPDFYNKSNEVARVEKLIDSDSFWAFMESSLKRDRLGKDSNLIRIAKKIARSGNSEARAKNFLKSSPRVISMGDEVRRASLESAKELIKRLNQG